MIIVERARHRTMATWPLDIGVARDISTTAIGRAYIVALDQEARKNLLNDIQIDEEIRWSVIEWGINNALKYYSEHGYTISSGDMVPEYSAVGVPLKLADGTILGFNCGGYTDRITPELLEQMGEKLKLMTKQLLRAHGDRID
jgi:DNA-binding IclR family transcriptional regulator